VRSGRYEELVTAHDAGVEVIAVACPRLVPLIEGPDPFGEETTEAVREVAAPLQAAGVDTVILGCTHYPILRPIFQRVFGRSVTLVFSADETADVGIDNQTPVAEGIGIGPETRFTGTINKVILEVRK